MGEYTSANRGLACFAGLMDMSGEGGMLSDEGVMGKLLLAGMGEGEGEL